MGWKMIDKNGKGAIGVNMVKLKERLDEYPKSMGLPAPWLKSNPEWIADKAAFDRALHEYWTSRDNA